MNKNLILALFSITLFFACNTQIPQRDSFNHHLTSMLGYEFLNKPGVREIKETHKPVLINEVLKVSKLLFVKFSSNMNYTYNYDQTGKIVKSLITNHPDYTVNYEYDRKMTLLSIAGYKPDYVKEIFEYHKDGYIKYIFRETGDNILYKYTEDRKTISCYTFRPIKDGNKRALKPEKLVAQTLLKNYEDGSFAVQVNDASDGKEIEKYTYNQLKLVKKEMPEGEVIAYQYDDYDNILKISHLISDKKTLNYSFEYLYDDNNNWIDRQIKLDDSLILKTERTIKYY